jgi:hypothetical protein
MISRQSRIQKDMLLVIISEVKKKEDTFKKKLSLKGRTYKRTDTSLLKIRVAKDNETAATYGSPAWALDV